jgi:hypothetical protein
MWMPGDCPPGQYLPVTWEEQTQIAVGCYNAGGTLLHIHVRDPKTGHISKHFREYADQIGHFASRIPEVPESKVARKKLRNFVRRHLKEDDCASPA